MCFFMIDHLHVMDAEDARQGRKNGGLKKQNKSRIFVLFKEINIGINGP